MSDDIQHEGGCHCGRVRFTVRAPADLQLVDCNCSICRMTGFLHLIVPKEQFTLLQGEADLADYQFGTGVAHHYFCRHCGIKSFYVPRSHPDRISVHVRCLRPGTVRSMQVQAFDGEHWEQARHTLA
jgi:hypothetical protein